jgi:MFS family permease
VRNDRPDRQAFRLLFWSSTVSNLGDGVVIAAFPLLASAITRDPTAVALVTAAATAPWLLFGLPAGAIADRVDRLQLMRVVDVVRALVVGALGVLLAGGYDSILLVYLTVFVIGVAETLYDSAAMAVVPEVVATDALERSNGRLFAGQIVTNQFLGPPLGALAFTAARWLPAVLDAITFMVSAALLMALRTHQGSPTDSRVPPSNHATAAGWARLSHLRADVRAGLRFIWHHHDLRLLALGAAGINLAETAAMSIAVLWATGPLGLDATGYGIVLGVSAAGAVIGSLAAERIAARLGGRHSIIAAVTTIAAGIGLIAAIPSPVTLVAGLAISGAAAQVWNVVAVTYRQRAAPAGLRGRVMSAYRFIAYGSFPLGALGGGVIAKVWDERATFACAALGLGVLSVTLAARLGSIDTVTVAVDTDSVDPTTADRTTRDC